MTTRQQNRRLSGCGLGGDMDALVADRVDGRLKVMGAATYPIDVTLPDLAHAVLVQSTVASGRIGHLAVDAADVREVDVLFVGQPDSMTPLGTKGVGELALAGMAAAIANAVYHATGTRVRSLPISIEKVLGHE